jgi:sugar phosphate isomerase/epimerase
MPISFALCNEVLREQTFSEQCETAAKLGYTGLEVAPFTLSDAPHRIEAAKRKELRRTAEDSGLKIVGLHWLLITPEGLSINSRDRAQRLRTVQVMQGLIELCADLGGQVLVHGSPKQRQVGDKDDPREAWKRAVETFQSIVPTAEAAGVHYCIEPLSRTETNFINSVEEAASLVREVGSPAVRTMIDTRAARLSEQQPPEELVDKWLPTGLIGHVHFNDQNSRAPGQGQDRFLPVLQSLQRNGYAGVISIEPFDYHPSGAMAAAFAIGYLGGILETIKAIEA